MEYSDVESEFKVPFLALSTSSSEDLSVHTTRRQHDANNIKRRNSLLVRCCVVILFVLYTPLCAAFIWLYIHNRLQMTSCSIPDLLPSPARESGAISHEVHKLKVEIFNNPFSGPPRPESDQAWHDLIEHNNIYISREEAEQANIKTLELADESGFVVIPAVGHQLHCLKRIRHWAYRDHYYGNASAEVLEEIAAHIDHCIEMFRQEIMCHGDQSFSSFYYLNDTASSLTAQDFSLHQCVNWPKLRNWMMERSVDVAKPGLLKPPLAS